MHAWKELRRNFHRAKQAVQAFSLDRKLDSSVRSAAHLILLVKKMV